MTGIPHLMEVIPEEVAHLTTIITGIPHLMEVIPEEVALYITILGVQILGDGKFYVLKSFIIK
jgi:hypothetical protein